MAYTFFLAKGCAAGTLQEPDWIERAGVLKKAEEKGVKILLPVDNVVTDHFGEDAVGEVVPSDRAPAGPHKVADIGPKTVELTLRLSQGRRPSSGMVLGVF